MLRSEPLVRNKEVLRASYTPPRLLHREAEARALARVLAPALQGARASHVLVTGRHGSGRSALVRYVAKELLAAAAQQGLAVAVVHLDCELVDTPYRVLAHVANHFISGWTERIPPTGLATGEVYERLRSRMDEAEAACVVVLDGLDRFVRKNGSGALASLFTLADGLTRSRLCVVGIAESGEFLDWVDPFVKERLSEASPINLAPYDAAQLRAILRERSTMALREGCLAEEAFDACVDAVSRNRHLAHGLGVLRMAAELAEQSGEGRVRVEHVVARDASPDAACPSELYRRGRGDPLSHDGRGVRDVPRLDAPGACGRTHQAPRGRPPRRSRRGWRAPGARHLAGSLRSDESHWVARARSHHAGYPR
ncbi:MAG: archaeal cell division control protein 6 [Thermoplasmata archaeon]|jgi:cell division control protein 6|nr:archaeal cell division control protein 6 [Thermoplasmata archaeon]